MNKIVTLLITSLALTACNPSPSQPPLNTAPLYGGAIGGPFTLTDQDGKKRSYDEFAGKFRIVYFGYTMCPDICTPDMQNLMAGLTAFEKAHPKLAGKVQPLFITVDPARDTPAILKQFVSAFHPRLIGLTGSEAEIAADAKYAYLYARDALKGPFPLGEEAISRNGVYLRYYVEDVLKADFYRNGKLIAKFEK